MKKIFKPKALCLSVLAALFAPLAIAADYSPYPKAGTYDSSDAQFSRELTVQPDGKFILFVMQKGKPGNLRSGTGEGRLNDAPGGWTFQEGRCTLALKRAVGGMQLSVQGCASEWGDVPFDGKYVFSKDLPQTQTQTQAQTKPQGTAANPPAANSKFKLSFNPTTGFSVNSGAKPNTPAPSPAGPASTTASPAPTAAKPATPPQPAQPAYSGPPMPTRQELKTEWTNIMVGGAGGKSYLLFAKSSGPAAPNAPIENFSVAAVYIDTVAFYNELSPAQLAKTPLDFLPIELPSTKRGEGLSFTTDCSYGKSDKVFVINIDTWSKTKGTKSRPVAAYLVTDKLTLQDIKPVTKVKCPTGMYGY